MFRSKDEFKLSTKLNVSHTERITLHVPKRESSLVISRRNAWTGDGPVRCGAARAQRHHALASMIFLDGQRGFLHRLEMPAKARKSIEIG